MTDSVLARNGSTSPLGKLDDRIEAIRIEGIVKARLSVLAADLDKNLTEFIRDVLRVVAMGPAPVKRMHEAHVDRVVDLLGGMVKAEGNRDAAEGTGATTVR